MSTETYRAIARACLRPAVVPGQHRYAYGFRFHDGKHIALPVLFPEARLPATRMILTLDDREARRREPPWDLIGYWRVQPSGEVSLYLEDFACPWQGVGDVRDHSRSIPVEWLEDDALLRLYPALEPLLPLPLPQDLAPYAPSDTPESGRRLSLKDAFRKARQAAGRPPQERSDDAPPPRPGSP